jgi:hypothetical protein
MSCDLIAAIRTASPDVGQRAQKENRSGSRRANLTTGIPPSAQPGWFNTHQYTLSYGGPIKKNKTGSQGFQTECASV